MHSLSDMGSGLKMVVPLYALVVVKRILLPKPITVGNVGQKWNGRRNRMILIDREKLLKTIPSEEMVARMAVMSAPPVDAEPVRHGEWKMIPRTDMGTYWSDVGICSCCGDEWGSVSVMKYCPNCGAKMDGEQHDHTD